MGFDLVAEAGAPEKPKRPLIVVSGPGRHTGCSAPQPRMMASPPCVPCTAPRRAHCIGCVRQVSVPSDLGGAARRVAGALGPGAQLAAGGAGGPPRLRVSTEAFGELEELLRREARATLKPEHPIERAALHYRVPLSAEGAKAVTISADVEEGARGGGWGDLGGFEGIVRDEYPTTRREQRLNKYLSEGDDHVAGGPPMARRGAPSGPGGSASRGGRRAAAPEPAPGRRGGGRRV